MAIKSRGVSIDGKPVMTMEEFKRWLLKRFDVDNDGRISKEELRQAIRSNGGHFASWKSKRAIRSVDCNGNGFIDESEIINLIDFAKKHLGVKVVHV